MSKTTEIINDKKNQSLNMSCRQQINYLKNKTKNTDNIDDEDEVISNDKQQDIFLDYHKYFLDKKERLVKYKFFTFFSVILFLKKY
jgi:hypothetical protein